MSSTPKMSALYLEHVLLDSGRMSILQSQMVRDSKTGLRPAWLMSLGLVLVTLALYWPVRHYDFVEYDDPDYVFENQTVCNGITGYGLAWSVVDSHAWNWHPVTWVSHMLDCQLFGLNPGAHHLVNVLLHCANSALLFLLLRSMTGAFWPSALVAALFAWHPLRVESVAWISERKDVLSGLFFMLTLWSYAKYAACKVRDQDPGLVSQLPETRSHDPGAGQSGPGKRESSVRWYYLTLGFFALGLLSKPMLVTVPFLLLLLDFWPLKRNRIAKRLECGGPAPLLHTNEYCGADANSLAGLRTGKAARDRRTPRRFASTGTVLTGPATRALLLEKVPFLLLSMAVALVTVLAQHRAMVPLQAEAAGTRVGTVFAGYLGYLEKIFWPHDLAVLYLRSQNPSALPMVFGIVVLLAISAAAAMNLRARPYLAVGWLWFLGMLAPVNGLLQTGLQSIADRYTYLPAIGLSLIVAWGLKELKASVLPGRGARTALGVVVASALVACAVLTRHQVAYWQNTKTLMEHALEIDPNNYVAHQDLARYYSKLGQTEIAHAHRQRVIELDPALRSQSAQDQTVLALSPNQPSTQASAPK